MNKQFKKGDMVQLIKNSENIEYAVRHHVTGSPIRVESCETGGNALVHLEDGTCAYAKRFELIEKSEPQTFKASDIVRCVRSGPGRTEGKEYHILRVSPDGRWFDFYNDHGRLQTTRIDSRFELVATILPKSPKKAQPIKSLTVSKTDALAALSTYVKDVLGIDAEVTDVIKKFDKAVELVLKDEAA